MLQDGKQLKGSSVADGKLTSGAGAAVGNLLKVVDIGSAVPGLPSIDGSNVTNVIAASITSQGTAATIDVGTAIGEIVQLIDVGGSVPGLPAVDGSNLTGLPTGSVPANQDNLTALVTTADFDKATNTALAATPNGSLEVQVNGIQQVLGGDKIHDCYFSADAGSTAKALGAAVATDLCYWVGSVAGYELAVTDKISFVYGT